MVSASEYKYEQNVLLTEYEQKVRKWLKENGQEELSEKIPFFKDGVVCPEKWFANGNDFRPLFILKEVSIGKDSISDVDDFLDIWGNQKVFNFVENPFDDVKIGKFILWRKIAALAKGLEDIYYGADSCDYYKYDFSYKQGGSKYKGNIKGYIDYGSRTANEQYNNIIEKIAILEIKKIGGGRDVNSELSKATKYYSEHIKPFEDLICKEIELINPTVVVCCSREYFTGNLLKSIESKTSNRKWIYGYHPTFSSIKNFYNDPLEEYKNYLRSKD